MRLGDAGELEFLRLVQRDVGGQAEPVRVGIGDDAAVLACPADHTIVLTCDAMVAGQHFRREWLSGSEIAARAVRAAVSDVAAMGGRPVAVLLTLVVSPQEDLELAREIVRGAAEAAQGVGARLVGGETVGTDGPLALDVVAAGFAPAGRELRRSGARPGDALLVSGTLGDSAAGLAALQAGLVAGEAAEHVIGRYKQPEPRVALGPMLALTGDVRAAIDISDGLLRDAGHVAEQSGVAVLVERDALPISRQCRGVAEALSHDPLDWAMSGGEDFELLFAMPSDKADDLVARVRDDLRLTVTRIGTVAEGEGVSVCLPDGTRARSVRSGWDQFHHE